MGIIHIGVGDGRSHAAGVINIITAEAEGIIAAEKKQKTSLQQEKQESSTADQGETIPGQEDQNGRELQVQSPTPLETPDK